jgi:hypothetical protein
MRIIKITSEKMDKATEYAEKMLKYGGKLMGCLEEWSEETGMMGSRGSDSSRGGSSRGGSYGNRYDYGMRGGSYGMRDDSYEEDWDDEDDDEMMGERRRRSRRTGRYM